jgi:uncharacterized protein YcfJ
MRTTPAGIAATAAALLGTALAGGDALADDWNRGGDLEYARVVDVAPIVREVAVEMPVRECWDEEVYREPRQRGAAGATIAGGIIGGIVGNQFGSGRGRDAATVVGGLLGAGIANDVARDRQARQRGYVETVRRCDNRTEVRFEERIDGYHVTYRFRGRDYTTRMREHPGERIALRVSVTPVG